MTAEETIYAQKALLRRQDWRIAELESEKEKVAIRATGEIIGLREQVRVLREALDIISNPGVQYPWAECARIARAAIAQTEPTPTP